MKDRFKRILILGHTGFIGRSLESQFRRQCPDVLKVGLSTSACDLSREENAFALSPYLDQETVVIVCSGVKKQSGDNLETFSENLKIGVNLARVLRASCFGRVIYMSSAAVYGEDVDHGEITERTPVEPTSYYGITKVLTERLLLKVMEEKGSGSLLIVRPPTIYGPGERIAAYGPNLFIRAALSREPILLWGDGTELREFVFVDDLVKLINELTFSQTDGILNLVSGRSYSFKEALDIVLRVLPDGAAVSSRSRSKSKVDHIFCNSKLAQLFPDFRFTSLEEGILKTLEAEKGIVPVDARG